VYNTGRSLGSFKQLYKQKNNKLCLPDVLITAVGTKVRRATGWAAPERSCLQQLWRCCARCHAPLPARLLSAPACLPCAQVWLLDERSSLSEPNWVEDMNWCNRWGWGLAEAWQGR
jgi:hypothetical protein